MSYDTPYVCGINICLKRCVKGRNRKVVIILIFDLWLLISVAAADYFCVFYLYLTFLLSNYFYLFISIYQALWPNLQDKRLLTYGASKNVGPKPVRGS